MDGNIQDNLIVNECVNYNESVVRRNVLLVGEVCDFAVLTFVVCDYLTVFQGNESTSTSSM